ncbi:MAG TPA: FAD-dependent monooxygenase [Alphaproteobacteria bacterium]|nr:FAD-dependent monooxygenase [Alphaproteobacteria bacterium]
MVSRHTDVLVVGAGPVGLAMAAELRRHGVALRIVDKAPTRSSKSKALVVWSRTLEMMAAMGCAERVIAAGTRVAYANIYARRRRLARIALDGIDSPYPGAVFLPQSETERLLDEHLASLGGAVERGVELVDLAQDESGVLATLVHGDGEQESLRAEWLIACDGAHSAVRHLLGLPFVGETTASGFILADVRLAGGTLAGDELSIFWHPEGALAIFPIGAGRFRIVADLGVAATAAPHAEPTLADVQAALDRRGPGGLEARDPVWLSHFRINERMLRDYRAGRVFLAGDAAHIHSPVGGQGMNTGIQDACGLAWRLALVCRGRGRDGVLLDSYSAERSAVGAMVLRNARRATRLALMRNPLGQLLRNGIVALAMRLPAVRRRFAVILSETEIAYPKSPLSQGAGVAGGIGAPGDRARDVPLVDDAGQATSLHRLLRRGRFVLICGAGDHAIRDMASRHGDVLVTAARPEGGGAAQRPALALIRPDGYVGLVARAGDAAAVERYLSTLLNPGT